MHSVFTMGTVPLGILAPPLDPTEFHVTGWGLKLGPKSGQAKDHWLINFKSAMVKNSNNRNTKLNY